MPYVPSKMSSLPVFQRKEKWLAPWCSTLQMQRLQPPVSWKPSTACSLSCCPSLFEAQTDHPRDGYVVSCQHVHHIRRHLHQWHVEWEQPRLCNRQGYVHIDVTYWGHNDGLMLALDAQSGDVLYLSFIKHETLQDYRDAVQAIEEAGYRILGIIIDGMPCLFAEFQRFPIQMCRFHMLQIIKRYLTKKPQMHAAKELLQLCRNMITMPKDIFDAQYEEWKNRWHDFLNKRTVHRDGKSYFLHRRVRSAMHRLDFYVPYLFAFQHTECRKMPNTNNKIEGTFADLKHHLNNHNGLTFEHRKQFIMGYFNVSSI